MVTVLYLITFLVSLTVLGTLLIKYDRIPTGCVLLSLLVTVQSFGRCLLSVSTAKETALLGNLFIYVGGCFCPLMAVCLEAKVCSIRLPKVVLYPLTAMSAAVFSLVLTIGHSDLYYRDAVLVQGTGYSYLEKSYGPAHILYPILLLVYMIAVLAILLYALHTWRRVPLHIIAAISAFAFIITGSYLIERLTDSPISYMSGAYLLALVLALRYADRVSMYDMPTNIANCMDQRHEIAYLEFDSHYRFTGYSSRIAALFPEIEQTWQIDSRVPDDDTFLRREIIQWMYMRKKDEKKTVAIGDSFYELDVHEISVRSKPCVGYMLEFADRTAENRYLATVENYNTDLEREVKNQTAHIRRMKDQMVLGMAAMVESRDNSTGGHIRRTSAVMEIFTGQLLLHHAESETDAAFLAMVTRAAPMHDLGKIAVDDAILRKPGRFTAEEYEKMKLHPTEGARIVREILTGVEDEEFIRIAENVAHYHHEKWDGSGYPDGLRGNEIPREAQLMALADVFDALVSKRCYKEAMSYDRAFSIISDSLGSHFSPVYGQYFLECRPLIEKKYREWNEETL